MCVKANVTQSCNSFEYTLKIYLAYIGLGNIYYKITQLLFRRLLKCYITNVVYVVFQVRLGLKADDLIAG